MGIYITLNPSIQARKGVSNKGVYLIYIRGVYKARYVLNLCENKGLGRGVWRGGVIKVERKTPTHHHKHPQLPTIHHHNTSNKPPYIVIKHHKNS